MPVLPTYNSQQNLRTGPSQVLRNEVERDFQPINQIINTVGEITQSWSNAQDVMQYTEAKANYNAKLSEIQYRAASDPDFKKSEAYIEEISDLRKDAVKGINNQSVAATAGYEFDNDALVAGFKIKRQFQAKQMEYNKFMVKTNLDNLMQKKLSSLTEAESSQYESDIQQLLNINVLSGALTHQEAENLLKDSQVTTVLYEVYGDSSTQEKDSRLLKELRDPKGKYSFLSPDDRLKMIEESQRRIFQNNQTMKRESELARDDRFNMIFTKANEGTLTLSDLDAEMAVPEEQGGIPKKQILDIRRSLQSRIKTDLQNVVESNEKAGDYLKFVDNFISDETDRQKGREAIVNAFKDNILSPKEAALLNQLKRDTEDIQWSRQKEGMMGNNLIPFKNAIFGVVDWFRGSGRGDEKEAAIAIKKLLNGAADGENLDDLTQKVLQEDRINTTPDIKTFPETGQEMIDPLTGVTAIVYPDGRIEIKNGGVSNKPGNTSK